jgi:hypothetical protein
MCCKVCPSATCPASSCAAHTVATVVATAAAAANISKPLLLLLLLLLCKLQVCTVIINCQVLENCVLKQLTTQLKKAPAQERPAHNQTRTAAAAAAA